MKKIFFVFIFVAISAFSLIMIKQQTLTAKINHVLNNFGDTVNIGIQIKDQKTGEILYSKNANHYFIPASNEKLFTAAAALESLNKDFTFQTQLFLDTHKIQNGILNDTVYLRFSGDPSLTVDQLDHLIQAIAKAGVRKIMGSIVIDDSLFDQMNQSPGASWDDQDYCWGAPINSIIIEHNCVKAILSPAIKSNEPAILSLPNYPQSYLFINNVITRTPNSTECEIKTKLTNTKQYTMNGCLLTTAKPKTIQMAVDNPRSMLQELLIYLFNKNKITIFHPIEFKKMQALPPLLASENSPPLFNLVTTMLKESDNMIANSLFKTMGLLYAKDLSSFQNGTDAVHHILSQSLHLTIPDTTLIDGSGASHYNFLTPEQIVTLLDKIYSSPYSAIFINALPISGIDGTLKNRMTDAHTAGKVFAKTGTLTSASTLSGYITTRKNKTIVFSIMINGFVDLPKKYQDLEDKLCETIIKNE